MMSSIKKYRVKNKWLWVFLVIGVTVNGCKSHKKFKTETPVNKFLQDGKGKFSFSQYKPLKGKEIDVYYYKPRELTIGSPILFVMHGTLRNADTYRDNWVELAEKYHILVVVPEFSKENFPGSRSYNYGNLLSKENELIDEENWSYSLLDPIFDYLISKTEMEGSTGYDVFGHSAGSQFVHRMLLFKGHTKANRLVTSNAGTYTFPVYDIPFPFGLDEMNYSKDQLKEAFDEKLIIQLGEDDTDTEHKYLNTSEKAMVQGKHRLERGKNFYKMSKSVAAQENMPFNWSIRTVPGVGHENGKMAIDAADFLYGSTK